MRQRAAPNGAVGARDSECMRLRSAFRPDIDRSHRVCPRGGAQGQSHPLTMLVQPSSYSPQRISIWICLQHTQSPELDLTRAMVAFRGITYSDDSGKRVSRARGLRPKHRCIRYDSIQIRG